MNNPNWMGGARTKQAFEMVNQDLKLAAEKRFQGGA
jgi:hypothetical protein